MGTLRILTTLTAATAAIWATLPRFGGENPLGSSPAEDNWHHEGLTRHGAKGAGWLPEAQNALAFHADFLDSYLYNPLWWFDVTHGGGPSRVPIAMSSQVDLKNLHFDDLVHPEAVPATWRRYQSGTVAGLVWLALYEPGPVDRRVAMAQNLIGASLHAIQDFYSHSNWIDDEDLRTKTWFEVDPARRECLSLWTGTYEVPAHLGIKPHGGYVFACSVINNLPPGGREVMSAICHAASPFAGSSICHWFRQCQEAEDPQLPEMKVDIPIVGEVTITPPQGIIWVEPGINVDSSWIAPCGVDARDLNVAPDEIFRAAYDLAARSSCQWLHILGHVMAPTAPRESTVAPAANAAALAAFWDRVTKQGTTGKEQYHSPRAPWEDFSQVPYRFLSAGPYPPPTNHVDRDAWYLRLLIRTSTDTFSGTDADIVPIVNGVQFPVLDHGVALTPPRDPHVPVPTNPPPTRSIDQTLMGRNDFEAGDVAAYMVGPLTEPPRTVSLLNDAPDAGDVIEAAANALWNSLVVALNGAVEFLKSLWGYHADFVDEAHVIIDAPTLEALVPGARRWFSMTCDGGSEGRFLVNGYVEASAVTGRSPSGVPWRRYQVRYLDLICQKESDWDRFTDSDEPFVLGLVIPHGGTSPISTWRTAPYAGVNSGDVRSIGVSVSVDVPQRYGFLTLACSVYESDDETPNDRDALLNQFAGNVGAGIATRENSFLEVLGASIASSWRPASVDAVAFRRAETVEIRSYQPAVFNQWIDGGHEANWTLVDAGSSTIQVPDVLDCDCAGCTDKVPPPNLEVEVEIVDFRRKPGDPRPRPRKDSMKQVPFDLAEIDPCSRALRPIENAIGTIDEPPTAPRPTDDCPPP